MKYSHFGTILVARKTPEQRVKGLGGALNWVQNGKEIHSLIHLESLARLIHCCSTSKDCDNLLHNRYLVGLEGPKCYFLSPLGSTNAGC
jgi:hypothetical protein